MEELRNTLKKMQYEYMKYRNTIESDYKNGVTSFYIYDIQMQILKEMQQEIARVLQELNLRRQEERKNMIIKALLKRQKAL